MSYPDDMEDFDAVREELVRRYGPAGKETHGGNYPATDGFKSLMGDRYDRWEELQQREDINTLYWDAGADVLPEAYMGPLETELESWRQMHPETTLEEFLDVFPVARLTWCSCSVFTPTFNTVTFDGGGYVSFLQLSSSDSSTASHAGIIVNSIQNGGDPGEWLSYMNYMDWNDIRQAAVDAGLDAAETEQKIIDDIWQYIDQQDIALTQEEYVSILTATAGLTGTPKEGGYQNRSDIPWSQMPVRYGDVVYKLYATNPGMFACMVLEQMPEAQQGEILDYFRYECNMPYYRGEYPYWKNVPSRAEALHELEADLARSRSQEISAYTFHSPGESAQYHFPDDRTGGTSTFESDDPEIATVDMIGLIVAVSPGETDIRIHSVSADGEEEDLVCHVRCDWTDDPAANAGTIRACIQRDASASAWIPLLKDTSWDELALNDVQDGRDWLLDALTDLWEYVQTAFPSQEEYRAILSCTGGLDGAYSELYAAILYRMYVWSPVQFAAITLRDLSAAQRDAATELLLYDWGYFHRLDDALSYPERLAILQTRLEEDRRVMHLLSPDAVILTAPGETDKLRLTTTVAISEISAETSDPQVVKVEPDGAGDFRITAVGPGEAEITVRCTITGLEHTYICSVLCAW